MTGLELRRTRKHLGLTEKQAAVRLGVSQPYVSLLERGGRRMTPGLAAKAVRAFGLDPTKLPLQMGGQRRVSPDTLVEELSALGYPGFAHWRSKRLVNPAETLLKALMQESLESRVAEALPWVLLRYPGVDQDWLVGEARRHNLQNRLGFVTTLAREKLEAAGENSSPRYQTLKRLEAELAASRLVAQATFGKPVFSERERQWTLDNRSAAALYWNAVSDLRPEYLRYAP